MLTPVEFELLLSLARAKGRVKTRDHLLEEIRDRDYEVFDRSIDVHISALRKKLGDDPKTPRFIRTVRAAGYMLIDPDADPSDAPAAPASARRTRVRFPLSAKILLWFLLNVALPRRGARGSSPARNCGSGSIRCSPAAPATGCRRWASMISRSSTSARAASGADASQRIAGRVSRAARALPQ